MAGHDDLLIVYAYLDTLAHHCRTVATSLDDGSKAMELSFDGNPRVTDAYDDFLGRWDKHRGTLRDGVGAAADAFEAVSAAFRNCEDELIAGLGD